MCACACVGLSAKKKGPPHAAAVQEYLETVIPKVGGEVLVVNGWHRGLRARLKTLEIEEFRCTVELQDGPDKGKTLALPYEDVCRLFEGDA